jgi:hypothetical protein
VTVHHIKGKIEFECDDCCAVESTNTADFDEAVLHIRSENWRSIKEDDGTWCHLCPKCKRKVI